MSGYYQDEAHRAEGWHYFAARLAERKLCRENLIEPWADSAVLSAYQAFRRSHGAMLDFTDKETFENTVTNWLENWAKGDDGVVLVRVSARTNSESVSVEYSFEQYFAVVNESAYDAALG